MRAWTTLVVLLILVTFNAGAFAQGPFYVSCNTPVRYADPTIVLNFDRDNLSAAYTKQAADQLVLNAIEYWNSAKGTTIHIVRGDDLSQDINITNYKTIIFPRTGGNAKHPSLYDGISPVIYDSDGKIMDDFLGSGSSAYTIGFATSIFFTDSSNFIPGSGYVIIHDNTAAYNETATTLQNAIAHEIGHMVGLDHSQAGASHCDTSQGEAYPIMYPIANCRTSASLHVDDEASIVALYPARDVTASFGEISGQFRNGSDNSPIKGANIYALDAAGNPNLAYSSVSDFLKENTGYFKIYLKPGTYTLHSNKIDASFTNSNRIGPYASPNQSAPVVNFMSSTPITITAGTAVHVSLSNDGSGTASYNHPMNFVQNVTCSDPTDGIGTGSFSWLLLLSLLLSLFSRYKAGHQENIHRTKK